MCIFHSIRDSLPPDITCFVNYSDKKFLNMVDSIFDDALFLNNKMTSTNFPNISLIITSNPGLGKAVIDVNLGLKL